MPEITTETLPKNRLKLSFTIPHEEVEPYLQEAAKRISEQTSIPGFRPGKAGYEVVKQRVGEMKIYEEALESIVRKSFVETVLAQNLETVGSPKIDVGKLAPGNAIEFTAEVTLMPATKQLADYKTLTVKPEKPLVEKKDTELALKDLTRMQTKEVRAESGTIATKNDKVILSMNMKLDGVPVDGGSSPSHTVLLNEDYYIPGLKDEVIGMKEGEEKSFTLSFPDDHAQKMLAGKPVDFDVKIKELYHLEPPVIDDEFASGLGMASMEKLQEAIEKNLLAEKEQEEKARQERDMLELIAKKSQFDDIPEMLVNEEINKMIMELKRAVESQGAEFEQYISNLGKTIAQMKIEFTPQALMRIKVALAMRAVSKAENIEIPDKELDEEIDRIASQYKDNKEAREQIYSPQHRDYMEQILRNRKVIDFLREAMVR